MASSFALDSFFGSRETIDALRAALAAGRLSHAVLLCGPEGCGRGLLARLLAADYLYPPGTGGRENAVQAVLESRSPEVITLLGQGASGQIPVEKVRLARQNIFQSALSAAGRVVLIPQAHKMTQGAANALLKVLEEPPAHALFILCAPGPGSLPPTIASRCAAYSLAPLPTETCLAILRKQAQAEGAAPTDEDLRLLSALNGGRLGLCLKAMRRPELLQAVKDAAEAALAASHGRPYALLRVFSRYEGKGEEERQLRDQLLQNLQDLLSANLLRLAAPPLPQTGGAFAAAALPPVAKARAALNQNAAPKITFAALAAKLSMATNKH